MDLLKFAQRTAVVIVVQGRAARKYLRLPKLELRNLYRVMKTPQPSENRVIRSGADSLICLRRLLFAIFKSLSTRPQHKLFSLHYFA